MKIKAKYEMGDLLRDAVSGFTGIVMGVTAYSTGCVHYGLTPQKLKDDGAPSDWEWFDQSRLVLVNEGVVKFDRYEATSGAFPNPPQG